MKKTILTRINKITRKSKRTEILELHEELNNEEDKAQNDYDSAMAKIHAAREKLNDNSNDTGV